MSAPIRRYELRAIPQSLLPALPDRAPRCVPQLDTEGKWVLYEDHEVIVAPISEAIATHQRRGDGERDRANKLDDTLKALTEAVTAYNEARTLFAQQSAPPGAGHDLWVAESNLYQALHEAKQVLNG